MRVGERDIFLSLEAEGDGEKVEGDGGEGGWNFGNLLSVV